MAKNMKQVGDRITLAASGAAISSGDFVLLNNMGAVALVDIADGSTGAGQTVGVWELPKTSGVACSKGEIAYWDESESEFTNVSTDNVAIGKFWADAGSGATVAEIKINC